MTPIACALLLFAATSSAGERRSIDMAQRAIDEGQFDDAQAILEPMALDDTVGAVARFGLANILVLRASRDGATADQSLLLEAVKIYRGILHEVHDLPSKDDVRHNLAVAKLLWASRASEEELGKPSRSTESNADKERRSEDIGNEGRPSEDPLSGAAVAERSSKIVKPTPAIADRDPGVLTQDAAKRLIKQSLERTRMSDLSDAPKAIRRGPGDY